MPVASGGDAVERGWTSDLEDRLNRLERENRRWKWLAAVGPAVALVALLGQTLPSAGAIGHDSPGARPAPTSAVVEAQRFVLRDPSGTARATLAMGADGAPVFHFLDRDGAARAVLAPSHLVLSGQEPGSAVKLLVNRGGLPALRLEKDGRLRAVVGMAGDGTLALGFYGEDGQGRALLDVNAQGTPGLTLFDPGGKVTWSAP
jgi:hypothetical protein